MIALKHHEKHHVSAANAFVKCEYKTRVRPGHTLIRVWVTLKSEECEPCYLRLSGEDVSETLIKVNLTIRSQGDCRARFNERTDPKLHHGISEGQMCAGGGSGQDTCQVRLDDPGPSLARSVSHYYS